MNFFWLLLILLQEYTLCSSQDNPHEIHFTIEIDITTLANEQSTIPNRISSGNKSICLCVYGLVLMLRQNRFLTKNKIVYHVAAKLPTETSLCQKIKNTG